MKEILLALALSLSLATCDTASNASAKPVNVPQPEAWKAVLIAGDDHESAFDNAADAMAETLVRFGLARADRPSFGCNAGLRYTIFDQCILDSMERGIGWLDLMSRTRQCVSAREHSMREPPSSPQLSVGAAAGLTVFGQ